MINDREGFPAKWGPIALVRVPDRVGEMDENEGWILTAEARGAVPSPSFCSL